ncbi:MAG TPA: PrsW family glutamic-type intramembrane protease [Dehalococcoidia bacterium]|nr:PrsW family glutamic-type intramembrane protease [Dehalococcoidia bacterium]
MNRPSEVTASIPPVPEPRAYSPLWYVFGGLIAVGGGVLGIFGAVIQELRAGGLILLPIVGAPIIEEALKPTGVYILLARWPFVVRNQVYTAIITGLAGLTFGLIESALYVAAFADDAPGWFPLYRFTIPVAMHTTASFIVGLGINRSLADWAQGRAPLAKRSRNVYFTAMALHGIFNTVAITLALAGVFGD